MGWAFGYCRAVFLSSQRFLHRYHFAFHSNFCRCHLRGLLFFSGLSLNQMTFGGLALGIGLIVDNAIVVLENIVRRREENKEGPLKAASVGTREVAGSRLWHPPSRLL